MGTREDAQKMLREFRGCWSKPFFSKIDECQKGIGFVLVYLQEADHEVIAGELARELNVSTARIAALLRKMEKSGLIVRYHSSEDARQTVVEITQAGTEYVDNMKEQILTKIELLLEKVGKKDMEEFIRISHKVKEVFDE
ncbi:MAG: MarR family transcriptional regulator [Acetatifactor sp.]|nr:MarR family transcriptional regulator [Acetatifactor sp.]